MAIKGRCTICGAVGKLTEDHVPPQAVMPPDPIIIRRLTETLAAQEDGEPPWPGHVAPTFKTLCADCNNRRLGAECDPALAQMANNFGTWVRAAFRLHLSLPRVATIVYQPGLVARAVIGHLLAAEPARRDRYEELGGELPVSMRRYFLSTDLALPPSFRLFVWPYPSEITVIGRGIGHLDTRSGDPIVVDTLKFFPLAFAVVSVEDEMPAIPAVEIKPEAGATIDDVTHIDIPLAGFPHPSWPERPQRSSIVLVNRDRVLTAQRRRSNSLQ